MIPFTKNDLASLFTPQVLDRGRQLLSAGKVLTREVVGDGMIGSVAGSHGEQYAQTLELRRSKNGRLLIGDDCSCYVGSRCKHVAALLLNHLAHEPAPFPPAAASEPMSHPDSVRAAPAQRLAPALADWLGAVARAEAAAVAGGSGEDYPEGVTQRLIYLLGPGSFKGGMPSLQLQIVSTRLLKSGLMSQSFSSYDPLNFAQNGPSRHHLPSDQLILGAINAIPRAVVPNRSLVLAGAAGAPILRDILATGRARWIDLNAKPLTAGPPRDGRFVWRAEGDTTMRCRLELTAPDCADESPVLIAALPPLLVDIDKAELSPVKTGFAPPVLAALLAAPAVPLDQVPAVSNAIECAGGVLSRIEPPKLAPRLVITEPPRPILRLEMVPVPVASATYGYGSSSSHAAFEMVPTATPAFRYGAGDYSIDIEADAGEAVFERLFGEQPVAFRRTVAAEQALARRLEACDLIRLDRVHRRLALAYRHSTMPSAARTDPQGAWLRFLHDHLPALEAEGWIVTESADFPYRLLRGGGDWQGEIREGSGIDWFELDLGVMVDGKRIDLIAPLVALISAGWRPPEAGAGDDAPAFLPLSLGRFLAVPAERLNRILESLAALFSGLADGGGLRFSAHDAGSLAGLVEATQAGALSEALAGGLVWRGGERVRALGGKLRAQGGIPAIDPPAGFTATLRPYQARGLAWLDFLRDVGLGGVLADDMGLGKTVQMLALIAREKAEGRLTAPALVIAPTSLMVNWQREAAKFAPDLVVLLLHGTDRREHFAAIDRADLVLTTYPLVGRDHDVLAPRHWHMIVLDEAQAIKNPQATTTRLIQDLNASHRFCLTGTPLENNLGELWSLFRFIAPGFLGDSRSFARQWRHPIEKKADAVRARLLANRVKPFLLRRNKAEVAADLPPKTEIEERIELGTVQRDLYESIRLAMHAKVQAAIAGQGFARSRIVILDALLKLRQVCCDPRLVKTASRASARAGSAKLERLMEMLPELVAEGRRVLVFSQFTSMLDLIRPRLDEAGIGHALLQGDTRDRAGAIATFQDGKVPVFLISLKSGGVGLNLTAADTVILYDPWWNPAVEAQAIDRAHRIGQRKPVFVHRLIAHSTIEEKMDMLKERKRALADSLFDPDGAPTEALTEADLDLLFDPT